MTHDDELERRFEGRAALQKLLTESGSLSDVEDVANAFALAAKDGVPASVVIPALWEEEPALSSPALARALFGNLLGLYDLVASGQTVDLAVRAKPAKREKTPPPEPFGKAGPDEAFVETAWRHLDDNPKAREKLEHAFDNKQDALVSWLDAEGLSDAGFALGRTLLFEVFAMLELGGAKVPAVDVARLPKKAGEQALPAALAGWLEEGVFEAETDEERPLDAAEAKRLRALVTRAAQALWAGRKGRPG
ncbi:MAG: hypothetical protein AMXMBFR34_21500 [Myxococcaceae bacterium]